MYEIEIYFDCIDFTNIFAILLEILNSEEDNE